MKKKKGIYQIRNKTNGKVYIGRTENKKGFIGRWKQHKNRLNKNVHKNQYLQHSWNKYGENNFSFEVIEVVNDVNRLTEKEQYWMDEKQSWKREYGYNIEKFSDERKVFSAETKKKISEKSKNRNIGEKNNYSKLTWRKVREIRNKYNPYKCTLMNLAIEYDVSASTIQDAINNITWVDKNYFPLSREERLKNIIKLTNKLKEKIREEYEQGNVSQQKLANKYNVALSSVNLCVKGLCSYKKMDFEKAKEVRKLFLKGWDRRSLAEKYKTDYSNICLIINNKAWYDKNYTPPLQKRVKILNLEKARSIRKEYTQGNVTQKQLAEKYGVTRPCIQSIIDNRNWKEE